MTPEVWRIIGAIFLGILLVVTVIIRQTRGSDHHLVHKEVEVTEEELDSQTDLFIQRFREQLRLELWFRKQRRLTAEEEEEETNELIDDHVRQLEGVTQARPRPSPTHRTDTAQQSHKEHGKEELYHRFLLYFVENRDTSWSFLAILGMRGVGKTTLLRSVRDSCAHASSFDHVFFVGAGAGCSVDRLQHVLSVYLGLVGSQPQMSDNHATTAAVISSSLKRKTFLLLLDDVRERLDLAAVGLPMPLGNGQKVIFTTRNPDICHEMSNTVLKMQCLDERHAWNLFREKVGDEIIDAHPHIRHLAKKMVAECRGLPSTLCTLGRAMSTKRDVKEWRYAYDMLLKCKRTPVDEIQDEGYSHLYQFEDTLQESFF